jgi:NAD(P)H-dependent flavin oxidoreductase YrpB (nitropropane dioxygenase family)
MSRKIIRTSLCDLLDIQYPILLAGMGGAANAELDAEIKKLKRLTSKPFGVDTIAPTNIVDGNTIDELRNYIPDEAMAYASKIAQELKIPVPPWAARPSWSQKPTPEG